MTAGREVRIHTLGHWQVLRAGQPVGERLHGKVAALLAYLAFHPDRQFARDTLAALFWPDLSMEAARNNLRQALHQLRKAVDRPQDASVLTSSRTAVGLNPDCPVILDAHLLLQSIPGCEGPTSPEPCRRCLPLLAERAGLYHGAFLGEWQPPGPMEELEEWLVATREQLQRQAHSLIAQSVHCAELLGDPAQALRHARRALALDPAAEDIHRTVMRLLAELGQPQAALVQYRNCCRLLETELSVEPDPETVGLAERLRREAAADNAPVSHEGRRQVAVVVWRFVVPGGQGDPEQSAELLEEAAREAIRRAGDRGGRALRTQDGGVVAYFGYPVTWEGATVDAVHAAREVVAGEHAGGVAVAAGVHFGVAVHSGDETNGPDPRGTATGPAMRAAHRAAGGEVQATGPVQQMVRGYFDLGSAVGSGDGAVAPVLAATGAAHRLEAQDGASRLPLLGREDALARLRRAWSQVEGGASRAMLVRGDAGIGKSRLVRAFLEEVAERAHPAREYRCLTRHQDTPYHPLVAGLPGIFQLTPEMPTEQALQRLEAFFAEAPDLPQEGPYLVGRMLGLPVAERYPELAMTPEEEKRRTQEFMLQLLVHRGKGRPQVLVVEDIHWADPSTLELLRYTIEGITEVPVLLLATARAGVALPGVEDGFEEVALGPLAGPEMEQLVDALDSEGRLSPPLRREIVQRSDGVPLFAEELARVALAGEASGGLSQAFPLPLADLMGARLDWLDPERRLVPVAATLGREFSRGLLAAVADLDPGELDAWLQALVAAEVLQPLSGGSESWYQFRHALIQEAAYHSQLLQARRANHSRVADALIRAGDESAQPQPGKVAWHLTQAGRLDEALAYWQAAAERAFGQAANTEAVELAGHGLHLASGLDETPDRRQVWRRLLLVQGKARVTLHGYGAPAVAAAFDAVLHLGDESELPGQERFQALWGLWLGTASREGHHRGRDLAEELATIAGGGDDPRCQWGADFALTASAYWLGDLAEAEAYGRRAAGWDACRVTPAERAERAQERVECFGFDTAAVGLSYLGITWWHLGRPEQALTALETALDLAEVTGHPYSLGAVLSYRMVLHQYRREPELVRATADRLVALAEDRGSPLHANAGRLMAAWADAAEGVPANLPVLTGGQAVAHMRRAAGGMAAMTLSRVAQTLAAAGRDETALMAADEGLAAAAEVRDRISPLELYRVKADLLHRTRPGEAEQLLRHGLAEAEAVGSVAKAAQLADGLGRLLAGQDRLSGDWPTLRRAYQRLAEGHATPGFACLGNLLASS